MKKISPLLRGAQQQMIAALRSEVYKHAAAAFVSPRVSQKSFPARPIGLFKRRVLAPACLTGRPLPYKYIIMFFAEKQTRRDSDLCVHHR